VARKILKRVFTGRECEGGKCEEENHIPQSLKSSSPPPQEFAAKKTIYLLVREKVIFSTGGMKSWRGVCMSENDGYSCGWGLGDMDGEM